MKRENLGIIGNRIIVKEFTGSECGGIPHFKWVTLIEVNSQHVKGSLNYFMNRVLDSICV